MAKDITDQKVGKITLLDGALIAASKLGSEMAMQQIPGVGNGTLRSGLIKSGVAVGSSMLVGNKKALQIAYTGVLIDGMEDIVLGIKSRYMNGSSNGQNKQEVPAF